MICVWYRAEDPIEYEEVINLFYIIFVDLPELGWYIYGNIIISESDLHKYEESEIQLFYISIWTMIYISYAYFLILLFYPVFLCFAYRIWKKKVEEENIYALKTSP